MSTDLVGQVLDVLLDHVEQDTYPSSSMMNQIESALGGDEERRARYVRMLARKIAADRYPSLPLISRVLRLSR